MKKGRCYPALPDIGSPATPAMPAVPHLRRTDAEDWITTKRRHLYGIPQGNIGDRLPGLPYDNMQN